MTRLFCIAAIILAAIFAPLAPMSAPKAAEAAGVTVKPTAQLPQVVVRENFIQQANKCIAEVLAEQGETRQYTVEPVRVSPGVRLPMGHITYRSYIPNGIQKAVNTAVYLDILVDGEKYTRVICSMRVRIYENVVVAAKRLLRETPLKASDLRIESQADKGQAFARYTSVNELVGKVLSKNVSEGTVLDAGMVREPIVVLANMPVNIVTNLNGVEIKTAGTTTQSGRRGDYIMVRNDSSGRQVRAKVIDENTVEVG